MSIDKKELEDKIEELKTLIGNVKQMVTPKMIILIEGGKVQWVEGIGYAEISIVEFDINNKKTFDVIHLKPDEINQISQEQFDAHILGVNKL